MRLFVPKELSSQETRAALTPETAKKLVGLGIEVFFEAGLGESADFTDAMYLEAGAKTQDRAAGLAEADLVFRVQPAELEEIGKMKKGAKYLGFLNPFYIHLGAGDPPSETPQQARLKAFTEAGVTAMCQELMPRSTIAQKMDAISSQANLGGYMAVVLAASRLNKILPMMMTPAGTISPAKVFVIGVGVAGLQAIATAKRLGARVTAFDTREEAREQAESLGAKALRIDLGETGATDQGYAKELTEEQLEKQRVEQGKVCAQSDIVITTAKLFGRKAPTLIQKDVIDSMANGSIIVDMAAETGGNVEGIQVDEEVVTPNGVRLIGISKLENLIPRDASQMYSNNLYNFFEHFWDKEAGSFNLDLEDPILKSCVLTHEGSVVHEKFQGES